MEISESSRAFLEDTTIFGGSVAFDIKSLDNFNQLQLSRIFSYALGLHVLQHIRSTDHATGDLLLDDFKTRMTQQGESYQRALKKMIRVFSDRMRTKDRMALRLAAKVSDKSLTRALKKCSGFVLKQKKYDDTTAIDAALTLTAMSQHLPTSVKDATGIEQFQNSQNAAKELPAVIKCIHEIMDAYDIVIKALSTTYLNQNDTFEMVGLRKKINPILKSSIRFGKTLIVTVNHTFDSNLIFDDNFDFSNIKYLLVYVLENNSLIVLHNTTYDDDVVDDGAILPVEHIKSVSKGGKTEANKLRTLYE